jgi:hypothetical protein
MRRRTCRLGKAVNSKHLLPVPPWEKSAKRLLLVVDMFCFPMTGV